MLIGASMGAEDLASYGPKLAGNNIMRIFPDKATISGKADVGVLPAWTDSRVVYCQNNNVIPFFSTKLDSYAAGLTHVKNQLINMPAWLKNRPGVVLWITDRHEPEGDLAGGAEPASGDAFKANFKAFIDMLDTLDPALRAKIWAGPVLTRTWMEKAGTTRTYDQYDPITLGAKYGGNFFAVDMYHETGTASAVVKPSTLIPPATFVAKFKGYKYNASDTRPRFWPELGLIGMPDDATGSARAGWIQGVYDECKKMQVGAAGWTQPWSMKGFVWWHQIGKATGEVAVVGQRRDFPLHLRTVDTTKAEDLPGTPPLPLAKYNQIWTAENGGTAPPPDDPGATTLSAGAPATISTAQTFARTASEPASATITARKWEIVSGPMGTGTTIGTTAELSWKPGSSVAGSNDIRQPTFQELAYQLTSIAENSTLDWTTAYGYIEDINDNRGYTGGLVGFTSGTGDMLQLVQQYTAANPGNPLASFIPKLQECATIGFGTGASAAAASKLGAPFITAWKNAAISDPLFRKAQRDMRKSMYWDDALTQALADGVGPLGLAIYYDVLVNHGVGTDSESFGGILTYVRASNTKPASGGSQTTWLNAITDRRNSILVTWGDTQQAVNGRVFMHKLLINGGTVDGAAQAANLNLVTPFKVSCYGDLHTIAARPQPAADSLLGSYLLRYTATGAGTSDVTVTVSDAAGTGGNPTPVWRYLVGATLKKEEIATYEPLLPRNGLMRIFPNSNKLPPAWDDPRFAYCQRSGAVPFVSSNIDGDSTLFATMRTWIINMPQWLKDRPGVVLYLTDRHEPENNFKQVPSTYLTNYTNWFNAVIKTLPADLRGKVSAGPVVTRQWIEGGATKGNGNYQQYDPGPTLSDHYGIDMYMDSWKPGSSTLVADAYINPVAFLAGVKGYRYNNTTDTRPRIFAEMGAIGIPTDPTGSQRAAWINGLCAELDSWTQAAQGWKFAGFAWWNTVGTTSPTSLTPIGTTRYFYLDKYQASDGTLKAYADPLPLKAFNARAADHYVVASSGTPGQGAATLSAGSSLRGGLLGAGSGTVIQPPVVAPPATGVPATGPAAGRALQAIYTVLVTDPYLNVLGDPLVRWQSLQATLRWKEPGSGQIVIPADAYVREQLRPGCRIVILRRVLGTQHILIAGPMEQLLWEKSNDADDNAGVGKVTITFVDDMAWLGARLSYPDPGKTPDTQTSDFWLYNGNPEQAMLKLVNEQAGPVALSARQVPKLVVAPYSGLSDASVQIVGTTDVSPREKFERVTDVLRKICTLGANSAIPGAPVYHPDSLGFRVRQTVVNNEPAIIFEPLRSRNLAGEVHFSFGKGNLKYFSYELSAPTANTLLIGGSGFGSDAYVREVTSQEPDALAWGRFEAYKSEAGSEIQNNDRLAEVAKEGFAESLPSARLASNASDTADQRYGIHYDVGDIVSVELAPGQYEQAPVQTVALQAFPTAGEVVGITVGDQGARYDSPFIQRFRELDSRLGRIERRGKRDTV
jgi:hypothetical protein